MKHLILIKGGGGGGGGGESLHLNIAWAESKRVLAAANFMRRSYTHRLKELPQDIARLIST